MNIEKFLIFFIILFTSDLAFSKEVKTIMITAGSGALGSAIFEELAKKDYDLILAGRNKEKIESQKNSLLKKHKINIQTIIFDFNNNQQISQNISVLENNIIDGLILISPRPNFSSQFIPEASDWTKNFNEDFIGPLEVIKSSIIKMKKPAVIAVISGITSKYYIRNYSNTNVIRTMWNGEIKNLCHQLSPYNIRINALSPGLILTERNIKGIKRRAADNQIGYEQQLLNETKDLPSRKYGNPEDVAKTIEFLINDSSSHINCENIALDGGSNNVY